VGSALRKPRYAQDASPVLYALSLYYAECEAENGAVCVCQASAVAGNRQGRARR